MPPVTLAEVRLKSADSPGWTVNELAALASIHERTMRRMVARWHREGWPIVERVSVAGGGLEYRVDRWSFDLYTNHGILSLEEAIPAA